MKKVLSVFLLFIMSLIILGCDNSNELIYDVEYYKYISNDKQLKYEDYFIFKNSSYCESSIYFPYQYKIYYLNPDNKNIMYLEMLGYSGVSYIFEIKNSKGLLEADGSNGLTGFYCTEAYYNKYFREG